LQAYYKVDTQQVHLRIQDLTPILLENPALLK
jgi:hypothetical protein